MEVTVRGEESVGMADVTLDLMEYANDGAAQSAYVSSGNHTLNFNNTAKIDTAQYKFPPTSLALDGNSDYISIPDSVDWDWGTGDYTCDFNVRITTVQTCIFVGRSDGINYTWLMQWTGNNLYIYQGNGNFNGWAWIPSVDTWYHVAVTRASGSVRVFIDGTELAGGAWADSTNLDGDKTMQIGWHSGTQYVHGWMDEVRILKGEAVWTSNFTAPTAPHEITANTVLLCHFSGVDEAAASFDSSRLDCYSEDTIKQQGTYSLKGVGVITDSLNATLTRTVGSSIDISGKPLIKYDILSSRTGSNIKLGIHDSGGTTSEHTPNISSADTWEAQEWDISGVSNANKDAIDSIILTILNADATNIFYIDNIRASGDHTKEFTDTVTLSEVYSRNIALLREWTETATLTEVAQRDVVTFIDEVVTLTDTIIRTRTKEFLETVTLTDLYVRAIGLNSLVDTLTATDSITKGRLLSFLDTLSVSDTILKWMNTGDKTTNWAKGGDESGMWTKETGGANWTRS